MAKYQADISLLGVDSRAEFKAWSAKNVGSTKSGDTIVFAGTGSLDADGATFSGLKSIEYLDFRGASLDNFKLSIGQGMVDQADGKVLRVLFGGNDIDRLDLTGVKAGTVTFLGSGTIQLSDAAATLSNKLNLSGNDGATVIGGSGTDIIKGGSGNDSIDGRGGSDTLTGGSGSDTFVFAKGNGQDVVTDFKAGDDKLVLNGYAFTDVADLLGHATQSKAGLLIDLGGGDSIMLNKATAAQITSANVTINAPEVKPTPVAIEPVPSQSAQTSSPTDAGAALPGSTTISVAVGTSADALNALIASAPAGTTILLDPGTHVFNKTILIARDDIELRGSGEEATTIKFAFGKTPADGIKVSADASTDIGVLTKATAEGQTYIQLSSTAGVKAGDVLFLSQANDAQLRATGLYDNVPKSYWDKFPLREQMVTVTSVVGDKAYLASPIQQEFGAGATTVEKLDLLTDVKLSDFTVTYDLGAAKNAYDFANESAAFDGVIAVNVYGTEGASVRNISVLDAPSHSFEFRHSIGVVGDNLHTDGSHNKGGEGNGYGLHLAEVFDSTFTNLDLMNNRHGLVLSSWHAEANNTIQIDSTNRDINFHGGMDRNNAVTVDSQVLDYDITQNTGPDNGAWSPVSPGGSNHPFTDIYGDNTIELKYVVASSRSDVIYASSTGSYIDGGAGSDTLHGSTVADTLLGGIGNDTLYGYAGADTIDGGESHDKIFGGDGNDRLFGGSGNGQDVIDGGAGDDLIYGGLGKDTLTGGSGADSFYFDTATTANIDTITDFNVADDTIVLSRSIFATLPAGTLSAASFAANTSGVATDGQDRIIYETDTGKLFYDSNGNAAGGSVQFAQLSPNLLLSSADFSIV